ncbi:hypothetical protein DFQ28_004936, partial [Apophysomyces sp. BC1034]
IPKENEVVVDRQLEEGMILLQQRAQRAFEETSQIPLANENSFIALKKLLEQYYMTIDKKPSPFASMISSLTANHSLHNYQLRLHGLT